MYGGTVGPGVTLLGDALDCRPTTARRAAVRVDTTRSSQQDGVGGTVMLFPSSVFLFTLQGEGITGRRREGLFIFGTATWRPRL